MNFNDLDLKTRIDGTIILDSKSSSIVKRAFDSAYNFLIKESSF